MEYSKTNTTNRKKILIISGYTPPATNGSGLMMYNLLKFFPEKSFAFLTEGIDTNPLLDAYRFDVPYYCYGDSITSIGVEVRQSNSYLRQLGKLVKRSSTVKFLGQFFFIPYSIFKIVKVGKDAIKREKPTILVGYSDFGANLCATYILHKITKVPFALFMYDAYTDNRLPFAFKMLSKFLEPKLFNNAKHIFVMCDPLKDLYVKKYNRQDITVIYNSLVDMELRFPDTKKEDSPFTIVYLGNVYWAQINALRNLLHALSNIHDIPIILKMYTSHSASHLHGLGIHENAHIEFTTCLPEEVPHVLAEADLAFAGLSFDTEYPILINTSSPGRLCDFLRSNTPILIHAPSESFLTTYAKKHEFAHVVDVNDSKLLAEKIRHITHNKKESLLMVKKAQEIGIHNHGAKKNAHTYYTKLVS
jgi:hypothetical protein